MEYKRFYDAIVVRLDKGEEILEQMRELAMMEKIHLASVQGIGAVDKFTIGVFDTQAKQFCPREYTGCYEIRIADGVHQHDERRVLLSPAHERSRRHRCGGGRPPEQCPDQRHCRAGRSAPCRGG